MIDSLRNHLSEVISGDLPGEKAHVEMAPIARPMAQQAKEWNDTRFSGVLVLLYPHQDSIHTALMMRPDYGGVHSRQVSFPGGGVEEKDKDIHDTALREAHEEMNINPSIVEVLGQLSELYIPPSKSHVTPVVGISEQRPNFKADGKEVAAIIEAQLSKLLDPSSFDRVEIKRGNAIMKNIPAILYDDYTIWGATAMMLNELRWVLKDFDRY